MRQAFLSTAVLGVAATFLVACTNPPDAAEPPKTTVPSTSASAPSSATSSSVSSTKSTAPTTTSTTTTQPKPPAPVQPPSGGGACPGTGFPTPACTGVPAGTKLSEQGAGLRITTAGTVIDSAHITGDLLITADNVTVRNSQIDGSVINEYGPNHYSFTISDSTVGPASGCLTAPGVGESKFTATRVLIRNHGDGFRASGADINIQDSYVSLCSNPGDHSDGIQSYLTGANLTLNHTTIDQRNAKDMTAPIFLVDAGLNNVTVTNNLVMGGTYSIQLKNATGKLVVRDNRLVDKSWLYGPVEASCGSIDWAGNTLVTIDDAYQVTSTVGPLPCQS
jgi:hypothetical protein